VDPVDWDVLDPAAGALAFEGIGVPWWVCGGWALERRTAVRAPHDRLVVGVVLDDVPAGHPVAARRAPDPVHPWLERV
jgi:hypothetical protein